MKEQNFQNHVRLHAPYHYVSLGLLLVGLIGSIVNVVRSKPEGLYSASLILLLYVIMVFALYFARIYALRAQDRAIRAEEALRHLILTGKPLDPRLRMGQIIALRFASDDEFPALALRAAEERMKSKQIKEAIRNWRGDYYRI
jgi:hypothetical protein